MSAKKQRTTKGTALTEFAPALVVFVCFVLCPVIDISFVPLRYLITQGMVNEIGHRLSLADTRSDAITLVNDTWWRNFLQKCGVTVHPEPLKLIVCGQNSGDKLVVGPGTTVPSEWLPNGTKGPCIYSLELTVTADIPPLYHGTSGLPGFTAPLAMKMSARSNWENLGRDPATYQYYLNE